MRCLVTGGTGLVGSNLAISLAEAGHDVIATGRRGEQDLDGFPGKILYEGFAELDWEKLGRIDTVFHEAAITDTTVFDRNLMFRVNVLGPETLFREAIRHGCKRIVFASSTAVYGNAPAPYREGITPLEPLNPYGESKKHLEEVAHALAREHPDAVIVGLRYCNVYGPRENHKRKMASMVYQLAQQMKWGKPRIFKHGEHKRDYIYAKDVVRANTLAANAKESCIVNCGGGRAVSFNDLIALLNMTLGTDHEPEYIENPHARYYQSFTECDMSRAREKLGFVPRFDIKKGIQDYFDSGFLV